MNKIITKYLKPYGFIKKSSRWYKITEEMIPFFKIDTAWYGEDQFFSIGAVVRDVNRDFSIPTFENEHIFKRVVELEQSGAFTNYNRVENLSEEDREKILKDCLSDIILPTLLKLENKKTAHDLIWSDGRFIVWPVARPFLGLPQVKEGILDPWKK